MQERRTASKGMVVAPHLPTRPNDRPCFLLVFKFPQTFSKDIMVLMSTIWVYTNRTRGPHKPIISLKKCYQAV